MCIMRSAATDRWLVHHAATQGQIGGAGVIQSARHVMRHGSRTQQSTFVHVATNTIHYHWLDDADARPRVKARLAELQCGDACATSLTIVHLAVCNQHMPYRIELRDAIVLLMEQHQCTDAWVRAHQHESLHSFLKFMFPRPASLSAESADAALVRRAQLMIVALTDAESDAAAKRIGFDDESEGRAIVSKMRLIEHDQIIKYYNKLKKEVKT